MTDPIVDLPTRYVIGAVKRVMDCAISLILLPFAVPLLVLAAVAIRLETPGPVILAQPRVGRHRQIFRCYKLRTMHSDAAVVPTHQSPSAAITRVGRILRRSKMDELPQLLNVLRGDMSVIGPRPCLPTQTELVAFRDARCVYRVRPGISGLAQVQGVDMSAPRRLAEVDAAYVRTASLTGDLVLMAATFFPAILRRSSSSGPA